MCYFWIMFHSDNELKAHPRRSLMHEKMWLLTFACLTLWRICWLWSFYYAFTRLNSVSTSKNKENKVQMSQHVTYGYSLVGFTVLHKCHGSIYSTGWTKAINQHFLSDWRATNTNLGDKLKEILEKAPSLRVETSKMY